MICHGELAKSKPDKEYLTSYYLGIAAGGVLGGFFVAIVAPLVFTTSFLELPILLAACAIAALPAQFADRGPFRNAALIGLGLAVLVPLKAVLPDQAVSTIAARRNFYGLLRVVEDKTSRTLSHGATLHGMQLLARHSTPTTYYGYVSGVGQAIERHAAAGPFRMGVVGLGTGTLARYGRPGDLIRFYELNPMVQVLARQYFTFLGDSQARVEIVEGDARLRMQQEESQKYDVLVIDAFSSDAIPVHLLTAEAGQVYARHLAPNGSLLIHISNQTLNLEPVVRGLAKLLKMSAQRVDTNDDPSQGVTAASWMVLESATGSAAEPSLVWTDDFSALLPIMKPVRRRGL
jgi:hypothetical protein